MKGYNILFNLHFDFYYVKLAKNLRLRKVDLAENCSVRRIVYVGEG